MRLTDDCFIGRSMIEMVGERTRGHAKKTYYNPENRALSLRKVSFSFCYMRCVPEMLLLLCNNKNCNDRIGKLRFPRVE